MIRQKYGNGYWIGLTLGICPYCFSMYHFVPLCFVLAIIISSIMAFTGMVLPLLIIAGIYVIANLLMSIIAVTKEKKYWQYILLPFIFLSLHISYGVGTLVGIIKMPSWSRKVKQKEKAEK